MSKHEPQYYRVDGQTVYTEDGKCVGHLDPRPLRVAWNEATGWWWLQPHECCQTDNAVAIDETMSDFSADFYASGPYVSLEEAVADATA